MATGRRWSVGDAAKVWSRSMQTWGHGSVKRVEGEMVLVEFQLPDSNGQWGSYSKGLHADDENLQPVGAARDMQPMQPQAPAPAPHAAPSKEPQSQEDRLHMHVDYHLKQRPDMNKKHKVERKGPGVYDIDGRTVHIEWDNGLVVVDGPLRQPFLDYLEMKESTGFYNVDGLKESNLNKLPKSTRHTFQDAGHYTRLEAMKVAKEQALFREKAAEYVNAGQVVPTELMEKYQKTLDIKLGRHNAKQRWSQNSKSQPAGQPAADMQPQAAAMPAAAMPASVMPAPAMPVAVMPAAATPAPAMPVAVMPAAATPAVATAPVAEFQALPTTALPAQAAGLDLQQQAMQANIFGNMPNLMEQVPRQNPIWNGQNMSPGYGPVPCRA